MVALAERYAHMLDSADGAGDLAAAAKLLGWMGPHLANVLRDLGGAPSERLQLQPEKGGTGGRVGHLRSARRNGAAGVDSAAS